MIKFQEQVPAVYPSASRDFQYMCWLINIVLNSVKHNIDDIYDLPNSKIDAKLTELLAMTLGFKVKRNYDQKQLSAIVAALPRILKYKGTKIAVDIAGRVLIAASGAPIGDFSSKVENGELLVTFPVDLVDISLFTDLLAYILPAGMTYHIKRKNEKSHEATTAVVVNSDFILVDYEPDYARMDNNEISGLSALFDIKDKTRLTMANYIDGDITKLNVGLLDNSIIPALDHQIGIDFSGQADSTSSDD